MLALPSPDYLLLLDVVRELNAPCALEEFPYRVLSLLPRLVRSERVAYNEVNLQRGRIIGLVEPSEPSIEEITQWLEPHLATHPLITHLERTGDTAPVTISDFWSRHTYHRSGIYNECYRKMDVEDQLAMTLDLGPQTMVAVTLNRNRRTFSERDRTLLAMLRPHLTQAYFNAMSTTLLRHFAAQQGALWDAMQYGALLLRADGTVAFCSAKAARWLSHYCGSEALKGAPPELRAWLRICRADPLRAEPLQIVSGSSTLTVRNGGTTPDGVLLLLDESKPRVLGAELRLLQTLGLTPRQSEVLLWLSRGATNQQIAERLDLSPHTTKRHLEAIYARLGVETRNAAAYRAQQALHH